MTVDVLPDSALVDEAIVQRLMNDATLATLAPGGVAFDVSQATTTPAVIVTLLSHNETYAQMFDRASLIERPTYLIKAIDSRASGVPARQTAQRIHELLQGVHFGVAGFALLRCERVERIRYTEFDQTTGARWQHRGGHYTVWVSPLPGD